MWLNKFGLTLLLLLSVPGVAQQQFDDLVKQIESGERYFFSAEDFRKALSELNAALPENDQTRLNMLNRMRCMLAYFEQPAEGIIFSEKMLKDAAARNDTAAQADYYNCRYYLFRQLGQQEDAEQSAKLALEKANASEQPLYIAVNEAILGNIASRHSEYADALQHHLSAYQLQRQLGYKPYISELILSISASYRHMGLYKDALQYIDEAEQEFSSAQEPLRHALILHEKAYSLAELGRYDEALALFEQSKQLYQQLNEPLWVAYSKVNLAWIHNLLGQYDQAFTLVEAAKTDLQQLVISDKSSLNIYQGLIEMYAGEALLGQHKVPQALQRFEQAEPHLTKENNARYLLNFHQHYAMALASAGNMADAYEQLRLYITLNNEQQRKAKEQQANVLRFQFDSARQLERNQQLAAEKNLAERQVETLKLAQRWQYAAITLSVSLMVILISFAISLKKRNRRLHRLAMTDELTGIANRRQIMMRAEQERVKALDTQLPLSMLIIDLDHFKQVNDKYGHDAGDVVLQQVCMAVSNMLREEDHFGRTGGEEFLVVLPNTDAEQAMSIAERIRRVVASVDLTPFNLALNVSCSLGVTQTKPPELLNATLSRADDALYSAKAEGRNKAMLR